ncbi:MAG: hypothetical protein ACLURV_11025 [Gallintestinimicrobium sp.]
MRLPDLRKAARQRPRGNDVLRYGTAVCTALQADGGSDHFESLNRTLMLEKELIRLSGQQGKAPGEGGETWEKMLDRRMPQQELKG